MKLKSQLKLYLDYWEISATQLARKSGVSKQVLSLWMSGSSPRSVEQIRKVAVVFGTTVDHLCFGEGIEKKKNDFSLLAEDEWLSGIFEIKVRKVRK